MNFRSQKAHPIHVQRLTLRILFSHKYFTFHPHHGSCCSCRHPMLTGSCLCDHTGFSHFLCQQYLPQHVINLMCTGMIQIFSLQIHFCPAEILCHMSRIVQPGRSSRIFIQKLRQFPVELRVIFIMIVGFLQFQNRIHQRLRNILSAVYSKSTF